MIPWAYTHTHTPDIKYNCEKSGSETSIYNNELKIFDMSKTKWGFLTEVA